MKGDCVYLSERDVHFPELSLGQTLDFALSTRGTSASINAIATSGHQVASLFGLEEVVQTQVGNHTIRGLSGGEKRRTSMAEAYIGGARVQCWDNSTRGFVTLPPITFPSKLPPTSISLDFLSLLLLSTLYPKLSNMIAGVCTGPLTK